MDTGAQMDQDRYCNEYFFVLHSLQTSAISTGESNPLIILKLLQTTLTPLHTDRQRGSPAPN